MRPRFKKNKTKRNVCPVLWFTPVINYLEIEIGRIEVQGQNGQIVYETPPISKITRVKWTGDVAQVVECLLCKLAALSSKPQKRKERNVHYYLFSYLLLGILFIEFS
jgi:hypothetical protein